MLCISRDRDPLIERASFLSQARIRVLHGEPDHDALELARREQPLVIIEKSTDEPEADAAFRRGLASGPSTRHIPLVLVAAAGSLQDAEATGAVAILSDPVDPAELFAAVQAFVPMRSRRTSRVDANLRFRYRSGGALLQAFSRDLSSNGVFLHTDRSLQPGAELELEFDVSGHGGPIRCRGIVRSVCGGLGVEFVDLSAEHARRLNYFIAMHRAGLSS